MNKTMWGFVAMALIITTLMSLFSAWVVWLALVTFVYTNTNFWICWAAAFAAHIFAMCLSVHSK